MFTLGVVALYTTLALGYSPSARNRIDFEKIKDVLLLRKGAEYTVTEMNRVLALAGLTMLAFSVLFTSAWMLTDGAYLLGVHGLISLILYNDRLSTRSNKQLSMFLGIAALVALPVWPWASTLQARWAGTALSGSTATLLAVGLGSLHMYTMELDRRNKLQVPPIGVTALAAGGVATVVAAGRLFF